MRIGVVVSCYRQERFLARTLSAVERALEGEDWQGVLELAVPSDEPLHATAARSALARGRAVGPLTPTLQESARRLDALIARNAADSAGAAAVDTAARR
ncbi:MAG: hypothetical protein AAB290_03855 [Candidatus Eisenbacteria bacterium]